MSKEGLRAQLLQEWGSLRLELFSILDETLAEKESKIQDLLLTEPVDDSLEVLVPNMSALPKFQSDSPEVLVPDISALPKFQSNADGNFDHDVDQPSLTERIRRSTMSTEKPQLTRSKTHRHVLIDHHSTSHYLEDGTPLGDLLRNRPRAREICLKLAHAHDWFMKIEEPPRTGCLAKNVDSSSFSTFITLVIMANCASLLYAANWSMENQSMVLPGYIETLDTAFTAIYVAELLLKIAVHRVFFFVGPELKWNLFDLVLVIFAVQEQIYLLTSNGDTVSRLAFLRSIRIIRVSRILRVFRVVRFVTELRMMLYSIMSSFTSLFWCLVLISLGLCMFSLLFLQIAADFIVSDGASLSGDDYHDFMMHYGSVGRTMATLYQSTTGGMDWGRPYELLSYCGNFGTMSFLFFIAFFNFAVFNVLTGIFVENAMKWAKTDHDSMLAEQREKDSRDAKGLKHLLQLHGQKADTITWNEFESFTKNEPVLLYLASIGIEVHNTKAFFKLLLNSSGEDNLEIDAFVTGCMRMKGFATSIDLMALSYEISLIHRNQKSIEELLSKFTRKPSPTSLPALLAI